MAKPTSKFEKRRTGLSLSAPDSAPQCDFKAVEHPGNPERQHDTGVKSAPAQSVEPERNARFDDARIVRLNRLGHSVQIALPSLQTHELTNQELPGKKAIGRTTNSDPGAGVPSAKRRNAAALRPLAQKD